jgi:hypothetical protein
MTVALSKKSRGSVVEQEDIWVDVRPNLLTPAEAAEVRRNAKFWTVWQQEGKRSAQCRICGDKIPAGESRLGFQHLNVAAQLYDKRGFIHVDEKVCQQNRTRFDFRSTND